MKDISVVDDYNQQMSGIGYEAMREMGISGRRYFRKGGDNRSHHVHVFQCDNHAAIQRHLAFRDYLRTHPQAAKCYGELKTVLAQMYPNDIEAYMDGKNAFVKNLEQKALGWYGDVSVCCTDKE